MNGEDDSEAFLSRKRSLTLSPVRRQNDRVDIITGVGTGSSLFAKKRNLKSDGSVAPTVESRDVSGADEQGATAQVDWRKQFIVQGKELERVRKLKDFLELEKQFRG